MPKKRLDVLHDCLQIVDLLRQLLGLLFHLGHELGLFFALLLALQTVSPKIQNSTFLQRSERFQVVDKLDGKKTERNTSNPTALRSTLERVNSDSIVLSFVSLPV